MEKQLPLMLSSLRSNIHHGVTIQVALMKVSEDLPAPLGDEFVGCATGERCCPIRGCTIKNVRTGRLRLVQFLVS